MFLLIDKPKGITSHDVVDEVRKITGERKVGHAGTLDPNATGLLIMAVGRESTKKLGSILKNTKKIYVAEIFLGEEKDTDDAEGVRIARCKGFLPPNDKELKKILNSFIGRQLQIPPAFSAIKVSGKKAYQLARKGQKVNLKPRKITIHSIKLLNYHYPILEIETEVSSGTYIRALARDIGTRLGCGAYLKNLQRISIGKFNVRDAIKLFLLTKSNWKDAIVKNKKSIG